MVSLHENSSAWERGFVKREKDTRFGNGPAQVLQPAFHAIVVRYQTVPFMPSYEILGLLRKTSIRSRVASIHLQALRQHPQ